MSESGSPALAPGSDRVLFEIVCDRQDPEGTEAGIAEALGTAGPAFLAAVSDFVTALGFDPAVAVARTTVVNSESDTASTGFVPLAAE